DDDRLCLDGQRLVIVVGAYNQVGSEYRTEKDEFAKIVQVDRDLYGPTGFIVYLRDGRIRTYGHDDGSASNAVVEGYRATLNAPRNANVDPTVNYDTPVRYEWALASERDRFNNRVLYHYSKDVTEYLTESARTEYAIDFKLDGIDYTSSPGSVSDRHI